MRKKLALLLIFFIVTGFVACGTYRGPISGHGTETDISTGESQTESVKEPSTSGENGEEFTVTLMYNGAPYIPTAPMQVQWSDGFNFKSADVDENGVARVTGLDGDYSVTLTSVPEGYTYNSNIYKATNDRRNITIDLYSIIKTFGTGTGLYGNNIITINKTGMYRATLKNASQVVYYEFKPTRAGRYSIESYVSLADNRFNPILDVHVGSSAYKPVKPTYTINDGGMSSTYTANFKYEVEIDQSMIGCVFAFGIHLDSMDGVYPTYVDFALQYEGSFAIEPTQVTLILPKEKFKSQEELEELGLHAGGTFVGAETRVGSKYIFDSTKYKLNPENGYYYLCNEDGTLTDIILCAKISQACRFLALPFPDIEYEGNKALTVSDGTENYKLFIEGSSYMAEHDVVYPGYENWPGYRDYCNADGVYPVTEELKEFLQKYSINQLLFMDGNGWVEESGVYAMEEDQWLFACGYYLPNP